MKAFVKGDIKSSNTPPPFPKVSMYRCITNSDINHLFMKMDVIWQKITRVFTPSPRPQTTFTWTSIFICSCIDFFNSLFTTYSYKVSINTLTKCMDQSIVDGAWKDHTSPFCGLYLPVRMAFANHSAILPEILLGRGNWKMVPRHKPRGHIYGPDWKWCQVIHKFWVLM